MQSILSENKKTLNEILSKDKCFDLIERDILVGNRKAIIYTIDGFTNGAVLQRIVQFLIDKKPEDIPDDFLDFTRKCIPHGEIMILKTYEKVKLCVFSGMSVLLVDGFEDAIAIDCREFPVRSVDEPTKDKVMRGSRDGFVETLVFNIALIRRRIRSTEFCAELMQIGTSSQTDVALCYMNGRCDEKFVEAIRKKLKGIKADSLSMNVESLAECIYKQKWLNPFPKFKYSERPDTTSASLLEGNVVVMVDNCPAAMIIPTTVFDIIEDTDDYYFSPVVGTYLRWSRIIITLSTILISPVYLLMCMYPDYVPEWLIFTLPKEVVNVPIALQFLILEFAVDGLKLASLNTPNTLSTPLSVIAGIVVGEYAISSGWFNEEVVLYMAFVTLSNYTQSSFELGYAFKFFRYLLLLFTSLFGIWGFFGGLAIILLACITNKTIAGTSYLYPFIPLDIRKIMQQFFRVDIKRKE
ncbi:MAG: spore germination protein [Lachnospiraceae bacterium]|nr:spore germination protein [Lachnospiraceae bacterium]